MAAESNTNTNMGFHLETSLVSALNHRHAISSLHTSAIDSTTSEKMILMGNYYGVAGSSSMMFLGNSNPRPGLSSSTTAGLMMFSGNSSVVSSSNPGIIQAAAATAAADSSASLLLDSVPGLKHDTGLAVEWSAEEQYKLEEGLVNYADEPSIMTYIKIAAMLRDKTVRDVALRCRWMTRKRRKQEDHNLGKKVKDRKDKFLESSSKTNVSSPSQLNVAAYSLTMNHQDQSDHMPCEALNGTRHLLEQNNQVLGQISANLSTLKLQDNIDLFCCTRNNITAIINDMREMPGIMSQMPPLPISMNEELACSIFPSTTQTLIFGSSSGIHAKQEPGC